jgi:hypothetical protein
MTKNPIEKPETVEKNANKNQDQTESESYNNRQRGNTKKER